jgi:predicted CoA-binding protein
MANQPVAVIIGASQTRAKYGNKSVRAHAAAGYDVIPVNPSGGEIEGLAVWASVDDLPDIDIDRISVYLAPHHMLPLLDSIAKRRCRELWLNPGAESDELISRCKELGINVVCGCSIIDVGYSPSDFPDE